MFHRSPRTCFSERGSSGSWSTTVALLLGHFHFSSCVIIADLSPLSAFDRKLLEGRAHAGPSVISAHRLFLYRLGQTIHLMST